jgi:hypothetical protein
METIRKLRRRHLDKFELMLHMLLLPSLLTVTFSPASFLTSSTTCNDFLGVTFKITG